MAAACARLRHNPAPAPLRPVMARWLPLGALVLAQIGYPLTGGRVRAGLVVATVLLGFGYGYTSGAGQWWHDQVRAALRRDSRRSWLSDCFEVVELHVRPAAQGHGLGAAQLRALLGMATARTTLLSTPEADEQRSRAWRLYRRFGFVDVLLNFIFPGDDRPFAILGRHLPLD